MSLRIVSFWSGTKIGETCGERYVTVECIIAVELTGREKNDT